MGLLIIALLAAAITSGIVAWWRWFTDRRTLWYDRFVAAIPVNSDWWKQQRQSPGELLYVAVGDSAAQGIGASRPGRSYVGLLSEHIRSRVGVPLRVVNLSISGATLKLAIDKELPQLAKLSPDILTVSIGANDIASFDAVRFETELEQLFAALPPHAIVADLPTFYFLPAEALVRQANAILYRLAERHGFVVVPLHARMRRQGLWGVTTQFSGDFFHPNDRGYRVWASAFTDAVDRRIAEVGGRA